MTTECEAALRPDLTISRILLSKNNLSPPLQAAFILSAASLIEGVF